MMRIAGIETEYGLWIEGDGPYEQVKNAQRLVQLCSQGLSAWDYRMESPRNDMRGFQVSQLQVDVKDAQFDNNAIKREPEYILHADKVLSNGARFYNDHGHPEYSTPECRTLRDLIAHYKAGDALLLDCADKLSEELNRKVTVIKNNTDYHGASYGCHENYLVRRDLPFERLLNGLVPFLATRILYAGAGKVGAETGEPVDFQIAQRADFIAEIANIETLTRRPIVNTRDEPHADRNKWRRLHIICGDANMMEYASALKIGATELVLRLLEKGWAPPMECVDPVSDIKAMSRQLEPDWFITDSNNRKHSALDVQRYYIDAINDRLILDDESRWVLKEWDATLNELEEQSEKLIHKLDWAAKHWAISAVLSNEEANWDSALAQMADLMYHNIDSDEGLYSALVMQNAVERIVSHEDIQIAETCPPKDTRALIRGLCVSKFSERIETLTWGRLVLKDSDATTIDLSQCVDEECAEILHKASLADTIEDISDVIQRGNKNDNKSR